MYIDVENPKWNTGNVKHFFKSGYTFSNHAIMKTCAVHSKKH